MKTSLTTMAACLTAALALGISTTQAQNLLVDPNFEASAFGQPNPIPVPGGVGGGWGAFGATITTSLAHSGSQSVLLADNTWNPSGVYQIVSVTPGSSYTASAWFDNTGTASGWGTPYIINLQYIDSTGANLGDAFSTGWMAEKGSSWEQLSTSGVAPANAAYAEVYLMAMNSAAGGANFAVDDASLTAAVVPEPASLALLGFGLAGALIWRRRQ